MNRKELIAIAKSLAVKYKPKPPKRRSELSGIEWLEREAEIDAAKDRTYGVALKQTYRQIIGVK